MRIVSKKRLEEMVINVIDNKQRYEIVPKDEYDWLIERVQELERENQDARADGFIAGLDIFKFFLTGECETTEYATNEQINNALKRSLKSLAIIYEKETGTKLLIQWGDEE